MSVAIGLIVLMTGLKSLKTDERRCDAMLTEVMWDKIKASWISAGKMPDDDGCWHYVIEDEDHGTTRLS